MMSTSDTGMMETEKSVCEKKGWENIMSLFFTSLFTSDNHSDLR